MKKILLFCLLLSSISSLDCKIYIGWDLGVYMKLTKQCSEIVKISNDPKDFEQSIILSLKKYITNHKDELDIVISVLNHQVKQGRISNVLFAKTKKELKGLTFVSKKILSEKEVINRCNRIYSLIFSKDKVQESFKNSTNCGVRSIDLSKKTKKEKEAMVASRIITMLRNLVSPEPWMSEKVGLKTAIFILYNQIKCGHLKYFGALMQLLMKGPRGTSELLDWG